MEETKTTNVPDVDPENDQAPVKDGPKKKEFLTEFGEHLCAHGEKIKARIDACGLFDRISYIANPMDWDRPDLNRDNTAVFPVQEIDWVRTDGLMQMRVVDDMKVCIVTKASYIIVVHPKVVTNENGEKSTGYSTTLLFDPLKVDDEHAGDIIGKAMVIINETRHLFTISITQFASKEEDIEDKSKLFHVLHGPDKKGDESTEE